MKKSLRIAVPAILGIAALAFASVAIGAVGAVGAVGAEEGPPAAPVPRNVGTSPVDYPDALVAQSETSARINEGDPVAFKGSGPVYYVTKADLVTLTTAHEARALGREYREADLMAPAHDRSGQLIGYFVMGVGLVTREKAMSDNFDLCAVETASLQKQQVLYEQHLADPARAEQVAQYERHGITNDTPARELAQLDCS